MRLISTSMLKPNMILAKSIYYNDCLILRDGQKDIDRFVKQLYNMGIEYVYIEDSKSKGIEIPDAISQETRVSCKLALRKTMEDFEKNSTMDLTGISNAIEEIINDILSNPDIQVSLNDISAADDYTFAHSVSTTVYSLLIAKQLNYSDYMMKKLAMGTILHDVGKVFLDEKVLFKKDPLTLEEFEYVKSHAELGYKALQKCVHLTELSRIVTLLHHERMDGSGYPKGVDASELHEFARIVAIADVYDALTTDRCYRKKWTASKSVDYLIEYADTKFDANMVSLFIQQIAIFPNGSMVRLSNDFVAIVKEQNRSAPFRPIVRVIKDERGYDIDMYEIDLLKELSITIVESEIEISESKTYFEIDK